MSGNNDGGSGDTWNALNRVQLIGNMGQDPEVNSTQKGHHVTNFSVAVNEKFPFEVTSWHRIVAWGVQADIAGDNLRKGDLVFVEGRLQTRKWEDREGMERTTTEVVASRLLPFPSVPARAPAPPREHSNTAADTGDKEYNDLPF